MIADKRNGGPLLPHQRPLQRIVPQDKAQGRSPCSLTKSNSYDSGPQWGIETSSNPRNATFKSNGTIGHSCRISRR
jgi:hypothetical protein